MSALGDLGVVLVEQLDVVAGHRRARSCRAALSPAVLDRKMCSASVEPMPSSTGMAEALA